MFRVVMRVVADVVGPEDVLRPSALEVNDDRLRAYDRDARQVCNEIVIVQQTQDVLLLCGL